MQQSQKSWRIHEWELQLWGGKSFSSAPVHRAKIHIAHKPTAFITDCKNHFRGHVGNHYMKKMKIRINEYTIYRFLMGNGECNCVSFLKNFSIVKQRPVLFSFPFFLWNTYTSLIYCWCLELLNHLAEGNWEGWLNVCWRLIYSVRPQMDFRGYWLLFNTITSGSKCHIHKVKKGKIHRAFTLIGSCISATDRGGSPPLHSLWRVSWHNIPLQGASWPTLIVARNKLSRDCSCHRFSTEHPVQRYKWDGLKKIQKSQRKCEYMIKKFSTKKTLS